MGKVEIEINKTLLPSSEIKRPRLLGVDTMEHSSSIVKLAFTDSLTDDQLADLHDLVHDWVKGSDTA